MRVPREGQPLSLTAERPLLQFALSAGRTVTLSTEAPPLAGGLPHPTLGFRGPTWDDTDQTLLPISDPAPEDLDQ